MTCSTNARAFQSGTAMDGPIAHRPRQSLGEPRTPEMHPGYVDLTRSRA
jgi:hypothetical protein